MFSGEGLRSGWPAAASKQSTIFAAASPFRAARRPGRPTWINLNSGFSIGIQGRRNRQAPSENHARKVHQFGASRVPSRDGPTVMDLSPRINPGDRPAGQTVSLPTPGKFFENPARIDRWPGCSRGRKSTGNGRCHQDGPQTAPHFSSYGSEKKGSPIRSFRAPGSDGPADPHQRRPVEAPDVIVVFHEALLHNPATFAGLAAGGTFIFNAPPGPVPGGTRGAATHGARDPR